MIDGNGIFLFWNREFLANIQSILLIWRSGNFFDAKNTISRPLQNVKDISQNSAFINVMKNTTYLKILYFGPQQCIQSFSCFEEYFVTLCKSKWNTTVTKSTSTKNCIFFPNKLSNFFLRRIIQLSAEEAPYFPRFLFKQRIFWNACMAPKKLHFILLFSVE